MPSLLLYSNLLRHVFFCSLHVHFLSLLRTGRATFDVFIFTIAVRFVVVDVICCRLCLRDQPLWCTVIPLDSDFSLLFAIRLVSLYYLGNFSCVAQRLSNEHKVHNGPLIKLLCRHSGKKDILVHLGDLDALQKAALKLWISSYWFGIRNGFFIRETTFSSESASARTKASTCTVWQRHKTYIMVAIKMVI